MKWHKKLLTIVLLILVGLGNFGIYSVSAAAPANPPVPLTPQGDMYLCDSVVRNVSFKWAAVSGATSYTIQLSSVSDFSTTLVNYTSPATEFYLSGINLSVGTYYWRVLASNGDGSSPWALASFHVVPAPPVLVSPPNNDFVLPNTTFVWTTCYPFDTEFQLSNRPDFSTILITVNFAANQGIWKNGIYEYRFYYPLSCGMYWWRVRTKLGTEMSPWTTQPFIVTLPPNIAPSLIAPQASIISSKSVNLQWSYVDNADRYQLQIYRNNSSVLDTVIYATSYNFLGEDNTTYSFRVRAGNPVGWGPWSGWGQFKILLPPNTPTLVSPFNGAVIQNNNSVLLTWNSIATADSYLVQVNSQIFEVLAPNNTFNFIGQWGNSYSWRIKAKNVSGESSWSSSWVFTIQENIPPKIEIDSYPQYTNKSTVTITGKVYDLESGLNTLYLGFNSVPVKSDGTFKIELNLNEGLNSFTFIGIDKAGNKTQKTIDILKDTIPPEIQINNPLYLEAVVITDISIKGVIKDTLPVTLLINNHEVPLDSNGNFTFLINLNFGPNKVYLKAIDKAGNVAEKILKISKISPVEKCEFQVGNPIMKVYKINEKGDLQEYSREIDPGRGTVPVIVNNRTFIPIRSLIENINGTVSWIASEKKIVITLPYRNITIELWIGKNWAKITDSYGTVSWVEIEKGNSNVTPFIKNDRSYFPLRFIAENLGFKVKWDNVMEIITIEFPLTP